MVAAAESIAARRLIEPVGRKDSRLDELTVSSEGDSPIFPSQKPGPSPAAYDTVLAEKWGFAIEQSRAARHVRQAGRDSLEEPVVDQLLATLR